MRMSAGKSDKSQRLVDWNRSLVWFLLSAAIPIGYSVFHLRRDLFFDEAFTIGTFVSQPFLKIATSYPYPNNHIFFSLLLRPFYLISDVEVSLRMLSLICTVGTLLVVFQTVRSEYGLLEAVCCTSCLGLNQVFLNFTMQVRGYSLSMFLSAILLRCALNPSVSRTRKMTVLVIGALFVYTIPTNILFVGSYGVASVLLCVLRNHRAWKAATVEGLLWTGAAIAGMVLYVPVWNELMSHASNVFEVYVLWRRYLVFVMSAFHDQWFLLLPLLVMATRITSKPDFQKVRQGLLSSLTVTFLPLAFCLVLQMAPFPRNFTPALPAISLVIGLTIADAIRIFTRWMQLADQYPASIGVALSVVLLLCAWGPLTFRQRLHEHKRSGGEDSAYYVSTSFDFRPSRVVEYLIETAQTDHYACLFTDRIQSELGSYLTRKQIPHLYLPSRLDPHQGVRLIMVSSGPPDYQQLSDKFRIPIAQLRELELAEDTGYFQIYKSRALTDVRGFSLY